MGCKGEVRGDRGYVVLWNPVPWAEVVVKVQNGDGALHHPPPADLIRSRPERSPRGERGTRIEVTPEMARQDLADIDTAKLDPANYDDWITCGTSLHDAFQRLRHGSGDLEGMVLTSP